MGNKSTISLFTDASNGLPMIVIHRYKGIYLKVAVYNQVTRKSVQRISKLVTDNGMEIRPFNTGGVGWIAKA